MEQCCRKWAFNIRPTRPGRLGHWLSPQIGPETKWAALSQLKPTNETPALQMMRELCHGATFPVPKQVPHSWPEGELPELLQSGHSSASSAAIISSCSSTESTSCGQAVALPQRVPNRGSQS